MIVDEIDVPGHPVFESKNNPPVGSNGHRPEAFEIALQGMKMKRWQVERVDRFRHVQNGENLPDLADMFRTDASRIVVLEQLSQALVPKTLDSLL